MRTLAIVAVTIALLPASAFAQEDKGPPTARTDAEKKADAAIDQAYQDAVKRIDASKKSVTTNDPWQTVRPATTATTTKH
ncbi:MAG: hypothetical protein ACLQFW_25205 [Xanthobacteraceae bacterium]